MKEVYNFGAGPAMLPRPVMKQVQEGFLDFAGLGVSIVEVSHRSKQFEALLSETDELFRRVAKLPENYEILYFHGGAQMLFSAVPLNLMGRKPKRMAQYVETGNFSQIAATEAAKFGRIELAASSAANGFAEIPKIIPVDPEASFLHITSNNTLFGTQYKEFPKTGEVPLVVDMTSEILSRPIDYSKTGLVYAGAQKNLGPSGIAMVFVRKDLIGHAPKDCPKLLDFAVYRDNHSMANTANTFAIWMINLVLKWLEGEGGVEAISKINSQKAAVLYDCLDQSQFYRPVAHKEHRSLMNVCSNLAQEDLLADFVAQAQKQGLYALKGHRLVGGARASIYNAMPLAGVQALADFMKEFERTKG